MMIECPRCVFAFDGKPIAKFSPDSNDDPVGRVTYIFTHCPKCMKPMLVKQVSELDTACSILSESDPIVLYPQSEFNVNPSIPSKIRQTLLEAVKCFKAKCYTASVIMCRRTLEELVITKGVNEQSLAKSIDKLLERGIVDKQLHVWASELRMVGNSAAHDTDFESSFENAQESLDFTIVILDYIYSYKDKFERFKNRTAR